MPKWTCKFDESVVTIAFSSYEIYRDGVIKLLLVLNSNEHVRTHPYGKAYGDIRKVQQLAERIVRLLNADEEESDG